MVAAATRELSIRYGSVTVGGTSTNLHLTGRYRHERSYESAVVEYDFILVEATEAAFAQSVAAVEANFRKPFQSLTVAMGSSVLANYQDDPANATFPSIIKSADLNVDSGRARKYTVRVNIDLQADNAPTKSLRESSVQVDYSAARRRTVTFAGTVTGDGSTTARSRYGAIIDTFTSAGLTALGGTYERVGVPTERHDTVNHLLEFEVIYKEILSAQSGSGTDDSDLVDPVLRISRRDLAGEDSNRNPSLGFGGGGNLGGGGTGSATTGTVRRLTVIDLRFEASVDAERTTDLKTKYDGIRSWLIQQLTTAFNVSGGIALTEETPELDEHENRISVTMTAMAATNGQTIIERTIEVRDRDERDETLVPAWTGNRLSKYDYSGPRRYLRTISERAIWVGDKSLSFARARAEGIAAQLSGGGPGGGKWTQGVIEPAVRPIRYGIDKDNQIEATEISWSVTREYFVPVQSTLGGGGGTTGGGGPRPVTQGGP